MSRQSFVYLSPYIAGAGIGLLNCIAFSTAKRPIGVSTSFESSAALLEQKIAPRASHVNSYLEKREGVPKIDWEWMLTAGIVLGSYLSARNQPRERAIPKLWKARFGSSPTRRHLGAFAGGVLMMFGARMAKGCTSGHGISGNTQLAASSLLFSTVFGSTAVGVAHALFGRAR